MITPLYIYQTTKKVEYYNDKYQVMIVCIQDIMQNQILSNTEKYETIEKLVSSIDRVDIIMLPKIGMIERDELIENI